MKHRSRSEKLKILKISKDLGVSKTSKLYGVSRNAIYEWRKAEESGEVKRRVKPIHPQMMDKEIEERIVELKRENPSISGREIATTLDIDYSLKTIYKKLNRFNSGSDRKSNQFSRDKILLNMDYIRLNQRSVREGFPKYIILLYEQNLKLFFPYFAKERSGLNGIISLSFFIRYLQQFLVSKSRKRFSLDLSLGPSVPIINLKGLVEKFSDSSFISLSVERRGSNIAGLDRDLEKVLQNCSKPHCDRVEMEDQLFGNIFREVFIENLLRLETVDIKVKKLFSPTTYKKYMNLYIGLIYNYYPIVTDRFVGLHDIVSDPSNHLADEGVATKRQLNILTQSIDEDRFREGISFNKRIFIYNSIIESKSYINCDRLDYNQYNLLLNNLIFQTYQKKILLLTNLKKWKMSKKTIDTGYRFTKKYRSSEDLLKILTLKGNYYSSIDSNVQALTIYKRIRSLAEKYGSKKFYLTSLNNIGTIYNNNGEYSKSFGYYKKIIELTETSPSYYTINGYANCCSYFYERGDYEISLTYLKKAEELSYRVGEFRVMSFINSWFGLVYERLGRVDEAREYFNKLIMSSCDSDGTITNLHYYLEGRGGLALVDTYRGDYSSSLEALFEVIDYSKQRSERVSLLNCYLKIVNIYMVLKNYQQSYLYLAKIDKLLAKEKNKVQILYVNYLKTELLFRMVKGVGEEDQKVSELKKVIDKSLKLSQTVSSYRDLFQFKIYEIRYRFLILIQKLGGKVRSSRRVSRFLRGLIPLTLDLEKLLYYEYPNYRQYINRDFKGVVMYELWSLLKDSLTLLDSSSVEEGRIGIMKITLHRFQKEAIKQYRLLYNRYPRADYHEKLEQLKL